MLFTNFRGFGSNKKEKAYGLALCFDLLAYWLERNGRGVKDKFVLFRFFLLYCIFFGGLLILFFCTSYLLIVLIVCVCLANLKMKPSIYIYKVQWKEYELDLGWRVMGDVLMSGRFSRVRMCNSRKCESN